MKTSHPYFCRVSERIHPKAAVPLEIVAVLLGMKLTVKTRPAKYNN